MRKMSILLTLVTVVMASSTGCTKCRNFFRRGSPCAGTVRATPAMIGAPMAIGAPIATATPAPLLQRVLPQMNCCPQVAPACPSCNPCQVPCEQGYIEGACPECGATTTYDQGYLVPGSEVPIEGGSDTRSQVDPRPVGVN